MRYVVEFEDGERFEIELDPERPDAVVIDGEPRTLVVQGARDGAEVVTDDGVRTRLRLAFEDGKLVVISADGRRRRVRVESAEGDAWRRAVCAIPPPAVSSVADEFRSPIAGSVVSVVGVTGAAVEANEPLLVIDAMKMQNTIGAPKAGIVTMAIEQGQVVRVGDLLATIRKATDEE